MSLRSGSPWTTTSRPMPSWRATTRSISARMIASYPASSIRPARWSARARRTSRVCGNDPIVVVGGTGRSRLACAASRSAYAPRLPSWSRAARGAVCHRRVVHRRRFGPRARARSARANALSRLCLPSDSAAASASTSVTFSSANESQVATSTGSAGSSATVWGTWSGDVDVDTLTSGRGGDRRVSRLAVRSFAHTLRPSTMPATRRTDDGTASARRSTYPGSSVRAAGGEVDAERPDPGVRQRGQARPQRSVRGGDEEPGVGRAEVSVA